MLIPSRLDTPCHCDTDCCDIPYHTVYKAVTPYSLTYPVTLYSVAYLVTRYNLRQTDIPCHCDTESVLHALKTDDGQ